MPQIIESNSKVLGGQKVIKGTRIPVSRLLALVGMEYSLMDIKKELPDLKILKKKDLRTILSYYKTRFAI